MQPGEDQEAKEWSFPSLRASELWICAEACFGSQELRLISVAITTTPHLKTLLTKVPQLMQQESNTKQLSVQVKEK